MKKVVKFGGSSLASAEQFMKVCDIIRADESRRYVVPSAPGKRFNDDIKVTDMLYRCYELAESGQLLPGQTLACIGFGGGLTWGGMIVEYDPLRR